MSSGRYRTSRRPIRTVGISPRRLMDHTRVFGTASISATWKFVPDPDFKPPGGIFGLADLINVAAGRQI
jgi:hypothetical protein